MRRQLVDTVSIVNAACGVLDEHCATVAKLAALAELDKALLLSQVRAATAQLRALVPFTAAPPLADICTFDVLGCCLPLWRAEQRCSLEDLAARVGLSAPTIIRHEKLMYRTTTPAMLSAVARALGYAVSITIANRSASPQVVSDIVAAEADIALQWTRLTQLGVAAETVEQFLVPARAALAKLKTLAVERAVLPLADMTDFVISQYDRRSISLKKIAEGTGVQAMSMPGLRRRRFHGTPARVLVDFLRAFDCSVSLSVERLVLVDSPAVVE